MRQYCLSRPFPCLEWSVAAPTTAPRPRRTAYPRIECYDTVYARVNSFPLNLWINFNASVDGQRDDDGSQWLDVTYPRYNAVLHLTYTPVNRGTAARVLDNRRSAWT